MEDMKILMNGADISACQQKVDFKTLKAGGYDFVIIRAGYGKYAKQKDTMFESHYKGAKEAGLHVGLYWYSYAKSENDALLEAQVCKSIIAGKVFDMPIWYDIEEQSTFAQGKTVVDKIARTFCNYMEQSGYFCGIYGGQYLFESLLDQSTVNRYCLWFAQYLKEPRYTGPYGVWQFGVAGDVVANNPTGVKSIPGVVGKCDMDYCYVDYPTLIKQKGLNGYSNTDNTPTPTEPETPTTPDTPTDTPTDNDFTFVPRLTIPEKGNPYYNRKVSGGYSDAIQGKPTYAGLDVLANCFSGDTKIVTRDGVVRLDSIVGKDVEVLSLGGVYRLAKGCHFGVQHLYKVILANGQSFHCTANHRWYVKVVSHNKSGKYVKYIFKETKDLRKKDYIPYSFIKDESTDEDAIRHGFIYGDGSYYNGYRHSQANLCGFKKEYMAEYFKDALHSGQEKNGTLKFYPYPKEYKTIPSISESLSYLRGFIKGLIASDGMVDRYGCTRISTAKESDAYKISEICTILGYRNEVHSETRDTNYKKNSTIYNICIKKNCIPISMYINPKQQERIISIESKNIECTSVKEIIDTGLDEDVYCVQEPETHTMTLDGCILTGQCVGHANARFNEIIGEGNCNYLRPVNAEDFVDMAISQGLTVSQTPSLGACLCWAKGKTHNSSDGCGHVAIVEVINADGSIVTSESGYNCKTPFWTQKRVKGNGNWGAGSDYTFLGFIENPKVKPPKKKENRAPYAVPTTPVREGDTGDNVKWLQWYLCDLGFSNDTIDGVFGIYTLGALLAYQFKNGLEVDGVCGPGTRQSLINA